MLRVMIVDDELLARQRLREMLDNMEDVEVVAEESSAHGAAKRIPDLNPDALFLDVVMPGYNGFALMDRLEHCPPVIFVTAHAEHAARAFDFHAVDYLLKPLRPSRLVTALKRLRAVLGKDGPEPAYTNQDRICLKTPERTVVTAIGSVLSLEADGDFTRVAIAGHPPLLICRTLGDFERTLPSPPFLRLDRSLLINLDGIRSLEAGQGRPPKVFLGNDTSPIKLGRVALRRLRGVMATSDSGDRVG